jgi:uroporphyrinogen-III decarboxylase
MTNEELYKKLSDSVAGMDEESAVSFSKETKVAVGGGFVLMPGCDIPPSTPAANLKAMARVGLSHKN